MALVWKFGLCDLAGVNIGEIGNAYDRNLTLPLNGTPTAQFRIRLDDPLADEIISRNADCLVKVYQGTTLRFIGDIMSVEEGGPVKDGEGVSITVTAAGPFQRLQKRLVGLPYPGATRAWTGTEANLIIDSIINQTNTNSDSGIRLGTRNTLYETDLGNDSPIAYKPVAEVITEMQASKVAFPIASPPSFNAQDTFSAGVNGSAINGRSDDLANLWASGGSGPDWILQAAQGLAYRTSSNDGGAAWAYTDAPALGPVLAGMDQGLTGRSAAGLLINFHLYHRLADGVGHPVSLGTPGSGQWVRVVVNYDTAVGSVQLEKRVGGTITQLGTYSYSGTWIEQDVMYAVRLLVDEDGNYTVWHFAPASWPAVSPIITGYDADLASTGTLASGVLGWGDINISGVNHQRSFDNIFDSSYTGAQSFDFQVNPVEPTPDASGYPGTLPYIGTLDILSQIGTSKPEVIFEYPGSSKGYRRVTERQGMLNIAYVLPHDFEAGTTSVGDVAAAQDQASINARGQYEEVVPSDAQDSQLRQALASAHVAVRKIPRQIITFEPSETAPVFGTDYIVGDYVTGRAKVNGVVRFNALFRIYGVEISVNDEGKADVVPSLVPA